MKLLPSTSAVADKATLLADETVGIVLSADDTLLIVLVLDRSPNRQSNRTGLSSKDPKPGHFRGWEEGRLPAEAWEIRTFVSTRLNALVRSSLKARLLKYNDHGYAIGTMEIEDMTPVDQSDLSNEEATPYEPFDTMYATWKDRNSEAVRSVYIGIEDYYQAL